MRRQTLAKKFLINVQQDSQKKKHQQQLASNVEKMQLMTGRYPSGNSDCSSEVLAVLVYRCY